jgi:hypothetical protein
MKLYINVEYNGKSIMEFKIFFLNSPSSPEKFLIGKGLNEFTIGWKFVKI